MKRRACRMVVLALIVVVAGFYPLLAPTPHRIDRDHLWLIKPGMTEAEVEAMFGVPAGGYDEAVQDKQFLIDVLIPMDSDIFDKAGHDQLAFSGRTMFISERHGPNPHFKTWFSRHGVFHVAFNQQGRVAAAGSGWGKARIEPFWRRWWDKIAGK